jgi:Protein of unknown function (DUF2815)
MASTAPATTLVTTGVIRGSYCNLFQPRAADPKKPNEPPKYGMTLLIPKDDTATLDKIEAAKNFAIDSKWGSKRPAKIDFSLHDGDGMRPQSGEPFGDECKGHMVIAVQTKFKPKILDRYRNEVIDPALANSGDYFKVQINFFAYDSAGRKGVSAGLSNVLFWDKGESLGGRVDPESAFADDFINAD